VCIDACMHGYGGEWPSGLVPLSSQTQMQLHLQSETRPLIDLLAETEVTKLGRLGRSIEHEVVPDSQCVASNEVVVASPQARVHFAQEAANLSTASASRDCRVSSRSRSNCSLKRRHVSQDIPAPKRRRADLTSKSPYRQPAPPARITEPDHRDSHSPLTPRTTPRTRLVMDCVEVVPLDEVMRRSEGGAKRGNRQGAARLEIMGAPKTPSAPRTVQERLERDEIVPETPDAVLQLIRTSPLRAHRLTDLGGGSPTGLLTRGRAP